MNPLTKTQVRQKMSFKKYWKIHGVESVEGTRLSTGNNKFYGSYEEALEAAARCCEKVGCEGIIIFEATKLVRPARSPVIVEDIL